jgi:hypothetical protein
MTISGILEVNYANVALLMVGGNEGILLKRVQASGPRARRFIPSCFRSRIPHVRNRTRLRVVLHFCSAAKRGFALRRLQSSVLFTLAAAARLQMPLPRLWGLKMQASPAE